MAEKSYGGFGSFSEYLNNLNDFLGGTASRLNSGYQTTPSGYTPGLSQPNPPRATPYNPGLSQPNPPRATPYNPGLSQPNPPRATPYNPGLSQPNPPRATPYNPGLSLPSRPPLFRDIVGTPRTPEEALRDLQRGFQPIQDIDPIAQMPAPTLPVQPEGEWYGATKPYMMYVKPSGDYYPSGPDFYSPTGDTLWGTMTPEMQKNIIANALSGNYGSDPGKAAENYYRGVYGLGLTPEFREEGASFTPVERLQTDPNFTYEENWYGDYTPYMMEAVWGNQDLPSIWEQMDPYARQEVVRNALSGQYGSNPGEAAENYYRSVVTPRLVQFG